MGTASWGNKSALLSLFYSRDSIPYKDSIVTCKKKSNKKISWWYPVFNYCPYSFVTEPGRVMAPWLVKKVVYVPLCYCDELFSPETAWESKGLVQLTGHSPWLKEVSVETQAGTQRQPCLLFHIALSTNMELSPSPKKEPRGRLLTRWLTSRLMLS